MLRIFSPKAVRRLPALAALALFAACGDGTGSEPVPDITSLNIHDLSGNALVWTYCSFSCALFGPGYVTPGQPLEVEVELARRDGGVIDDEIRLEMAGPGVTWTPGAQANNRRRGTLSCTEAGRSAGATVALYRKGKRIWHLDGVLFGCA